MKLSPMPQYFLVRVPKEEQRKRLEKIGILYYPPEYAYMKRGMQAGEIMKIGIDAHNHFPEAKIGHILLFHHFIEHKETKRGRKFFVVDEDKRYNYYAVTGMDHNGDKNLSYAVWTGEELIPNKGYIFLFPEAKAVSDMDDFHFHEGGSDFRTNIAFTEAGSALVIPKERKLTREELMQKMKDNVERVKKIAPFISMRPDVAPEIIRLEQENNKMSKIINTKKYEPFEIAGINEEYQRFLYDSFGCLVGGNDIVYVLNIAAHMIIEFMGVEYIVTETKYIFCPLEWITESVKQYRCRNNPNAFKG